MLFAFKVVLCVALAHCVEDIKYVEQRELVILIIPLKVQDGAVRDEEWVKHLIVKHYCLGLIIECIFQVLVGGCFSEVW